MSNSLLAWDNLVTLTSTTVTATSAEVALPASNLQNDQGDTGSAWQTLNTVVTATLTVTPASTGRTWRVVGLFRSNLLSSASIVWTLYNNPSTVVYTHTSSGPIGGTGQVVHVIASDQTADYLTIAITDSGNPDAHLNVALAFAGPAWLPTNGFSYSTLYGRDENASKLVSRGGQKFIRNYWQQRRWDVDMQNLRTSTELWPSLDAMMSVANLGSNVLMVPDIASTSLGYEATFGDLMQIADVGFPQHGNIVRSWRGRVMERL